MSKKALTPLAATFVLLVFCLAIGVAVMSFGEAYIGQDGQEITDNANEMGILKEQFMNDEISAEEYERRKAGILEG